MKVKIKKLFLAVVILSGVKAFAQTSLDYLKVGDDKFRQKDFLGAINDFTQSLKIDSTYTTAYFFRGNAKYEIKDYKGAIADFTKLIVADNKDENVYLNR